MIEVGLNANQLKQAQNVLAYLGKPCRIVRARETAHLHIQHRPDLRFEYWNPFAVHRSDWIELLNLRGMVVAQEVYHVTPDGTECRHWVTNYKGVRHSAGYAEGDAARILASTLVEVVSLAFTKGAHL